HTRCLSDWSSDVCSSDLTTGRHDRGQKRDWVGNLVHPALPGQHEPGRGSCRELILRLEDTMFRILVKTETVAVEEQLYTVRYFEIGRASCRERAKGRGGW